MFMFNFNHIHINWQHVWIQLLEIGRRNGEMPILVDEFQAKLSSCFFFNQHSLEKRYYDQRYLWIKNVIIYE